MRADRDWRAHTDGILRAELGIRNLSYADLGELLTAISLKENEKNVNNKIARGSFTPVFFLQCLKDIGTRTLHLDATLADHQKV